MKGLVKPAEPRRERIPAPIVIDSDVSNRGQKMNNPGDLYERAARCVGYANVSRYRARANSLFRGLDFNGASVLEVGCGTGAWAIWAALQGAAKTVGIDPEADGSTRGTLDLFRKNVEALGLEKRVEAHRCTLQEFTANAAAGTQFDIVIMYAVINHLDEEAVVRLGQDDGMVERFLTILRPLRAITRTGGTVIVSDCSRSNLWPDLGIGSPFDKSIEWSKHQNPPVWIRVFGRAGFKSAKWDWSPLYPLGKLSTNSLVQYLTRSHFVIQFKAV